MSVVKRWVLASLCVLLVVSASVPAMAQTYPVPIGAEQAFDATVAQKDPLTGESRTVILVDIRSRAEFSWVGTAAKVTEIVFLDGEKVVPDHGKVTLEHDGMFIVYNVKGRNKRALVQKVKSMATTAIAVSIPYKLWNETEGKLVTNPDFAAEIAKLQGDNVVLIVFCRSGERSGEDQCGAVISPTGFDALYEIDQPDKTTGNGGFEGNTYGNVFNGYRGFPGRDTWTQIHPSVSWKDAGLPIKIGAPLPALPAK
jgi:rhodanese-related sulfurtransferase